MNIEYKPLTEAEHDQLVEAELYAFGGSRADAERYIAISPAGSFRGLYDDGRLVSQMQILPLAVSIGHADLPLGGVASVATPPEHRRRGYVDQMLLAACGEMRERGMALCILHPFKNSFYRRFGWGTCQERRRYTGEPALFVPFLRQQRGQFTAGSDADIVELNGIYTRALRGRFGPIVRDEAWWRNHVLHDGTKTNNVSIWRDETGRGRSYLAYRLEQHAGDRHMRIREIVAVDAEARAQLFAFIANHDSQAKQVTFVAPTDAPVNLLMPDPLYCEAEPYFMLRLLDVARALAEYRYPRGVAGTVSIAVNDGWLTDNQGMYQLHVANGRAEVIRQPHGNHADVTIDVAVLAQLYARYLRPRTAASFGLLDVHNQAALVTLDAMFAGLAPFSSDFF